MTHHNPTHPHPIPTIDLATVDRQVLDQYAQLHYGTSRFDNLNELGKGFVADLIARDISEGRDIAGNKITLGNLGM